MSEVDAYFSSYNTQLLAAFKSRAASFSFPFNTEASKDSVASKVNAVDPLSALAWIFASKFAETSGEEAARFLFDKLREWTSPSSNDELVRRIEESIERLKKFIHQELDRREREESVRKLRALTLHVRGYSPNNPNQIVLGSALLPSAELLVYFQGLGLSGIELFAFTLVLRNGILVEAVRTGSFDRESWRREIFEWSQWGSSQIFQWNMNNLVYVFKLVLPPIVSSGYTGRVTVGGKEVFSIRGSQAKVEAATEKAYVEAIEKYEKPIRTLWDSLSGTFSQLISSVK